ncbi:MAG: hypothetical protein HQL31_04035 [Planctomycetes bacterium]|nr:hypothetical protein [Planctomycetota bacterium]
MSKVLSDKECLDVIYRAINNAEIDDSDSYSHFLEDLGNLIADHFGGRFTRLSTPDSLNSEDDEYCLHFEHNENVPSDGGIFKYYDTDVSIQEWISDSQWRENVENKPVGSLLLGIENDLKGSSGSNP